MTVDAVYYSITCLKATKRADSAKSKFHATSFQNSLAFWLQPGRSFASLLTKLQFTVDLPPAAPNNADLTTRRTADVGESGVRLGLLKAPGKLHWAPSPLTWPITSCRRQLRAKKKLHNWPFWHYITAFHSFPLSSHLAFLFAPFHASPLYLPSFSDHFPES